MNAVQRFFPKIINGASQFIIPVFQRDYSWSEENCRHLWQDLLAIADAGPDRGHFIGSVVYIQTGDSSAGFTRWLLIDGQQRVTTLTLLLTALRDHIRKTGWQGSDDGPTVKRIDAYFLRNLQEEGEREVKLKLRRHDDATLQALINEQPEPATPSTRIRDNYDLFRELLEDADPETVYRGINRLLLVDVTLDRGIDDPQLIFESLNSTGVDLSPSDLIRNFILMRLPEKEQTRLYETYWNRIEELFRGSERVIDWEVFEREWAGLFPSQTLRPAKPTRLVAGLFYLQHASRLSHEAVVARWAENPYWQHFCGETFFHPDALRDLCPCRLAPGRGGHVCVSRGGRQLGVAEQHLNHPHVSVRLQKVGGKAVP